MQKSFFWLHIKKSAGTSFREALGKAYTQVNRNNPQPFISLPRHYWNDNLNNYRIHLGPYDFRRALFAKNFLYTSDEWDSMFKFCIVRNPYDRIVSAYEYFLSREPMLYALRLLPKKIGFSIFIHKISSILSKTSPRHLATHIAPIYADISDNNQNVLMDYCARLEHIQTELPFLSSQIGKQIELPTLNKSRSKKPLSYRSYFTKSSRRTFEDIYFYDIEKLNYDF